MINNYIVKILIYFVKESRNKKKTGFVSPIFVVCSPTELCSEYATVDLPNAMVQRKR